jgi:ABC-type enterochelin transport system ATPase subunit
VKLQVRTPAGFSIAVTRMIGRDETVAALVSRLSRQRLVTIVGPGGIGKTTVALAVAERMLASYEHGVWLVDLAPLADPRRERILLIFFSCTMAKPPCECAC